jgi:uncharacterized cupredoxin-like copper-binding protein
MGGGNRFTTGEKGEEHMKVGTFRVLCLLAVCALAGSLSACGGGNDNAVDTTLSDFAISIDPTSATAGEVTFDISNDGPSQHEFVVFRTDLAPDQLPTTEDENGIPIVDEEGEGIEPVDEVEDINPDTSATLTVNLSAGNYVLICNLPSHYQQGMHTTLTVSG